MVWQEKSEFIFMLCDAVDADSLNLFNSCGVSNHCPYYWPRYEGEVCHLGRLNVRNVKLDSALDPVFSVTHLELWVEDEPDTKHRVQHWHWDWRDFSDFHWPFRLLLRSRHSRRPTIIQCADGCGRSGTLVLIEVVLMQLLRGAVSHYNPLLTAAVFLRLQRRHAVSNQLQWLFVYRAVVHWIQPFVVSLYNRFVLFGLLYPKGTGGFIAKYAETVGKLQRSLQHQSQSHRQRKIAYK